ncbi:Kelch repeat-containing protein [Pyxidicoccus sp. 3LG]
MQRLSSRGIASHAVALGLLALAISGLSACTPASEPATARHPVAVSPAALATPGWAATGSMVQRRYIHTATLLPTGQVLVVGGRGNEWLSSAELFDPSTGTWATTGALAQTREGHTATLLNSGKVLVVGGIHYGDPRTYAQLYDPATGEWTAAGQLGEARKFHTATLLRSGKVLVVAGRGESEDLASAELYDPATNTWAPTGALEVASSEHAAVLLTDGRGAGGGGAFGATLYDPGHRAAWDDRGTMIPRPEPYASPPVTLLPSGKVLVAGGDYIDTLASAELYDPELDRWSSTGSLAVARDGHTATLLPSGKVLVTGGWDDNGGSLASAELYDPATGTWSPTTGLTVERARHTATLLPSGRVLVVGGHSGPDLAVASRGAV